VYRSIGMTQDGGGDERHMYIGTVANAGSGMVLGRESNGGCSRYSAPHFGLSTSVAVQGAVVFHPILFKIGGGLHVRFSSTTRLGCCRGCSVASSDEMMIQASGDHCPRKPSQVSCRDLRVAG